MKKKIFLFFMLLLLTGCSATYDLYVSDKFIDDIFIYDDNSVIKELDYYDMNEDNVNNINYYNYNISLFEKDFNYDSEEYSNNSVSGYIYNYTYDAEDINKKSMIYNCYDSINITNNDMLLIETSNKFKCFDEYLLLDDVTVNIHYSGNLIDTNADSYEDDIYTWYINKNNYNNKKIYLKLEKNKKNYTFDIVCGIIFGVLTLISVLFLVKYKNKTI